MKRADALLAAAKLVTEERNATYGEPVPQLAHAQEIKEAVGHRESEHLSHAEIEAIDAICVKLSRLAFGTPTEDSWLDIIGYAAIGAEARDSAYSTSSDTTSAFAPKNSRKD